MWDGAVGRSCKSHLQGPQSRQYWDTQETCAFFEDRAGSCLINYQAHYRSGLRTNDCPQIQDKHVLTMLESLAAKQLVCND